MLSRVLNKPYPEPAQAIQQILEDAQAGKFSPEVEKICTAYVKTRLKESTDGKTVLFKTGGKVSYLIVSFAAVIRVVTQRFCPTLVGEKRQRANFKSEAIRRGGVWWGGAKKVSLAFYAAFAVQLA